MKNNLFKSYKIKLQSFAPVHIGCITDFEPTNYVMCSDENKNCLQAEEIKCSFCGYVNKVKDVKKYPYCFRCDCEIELSDIETENKSSKQTSDKAYLYTFTPKELAQSLSDAEKNKLLDIARKGNYISLEAFFKEHTLKIVANAKKHSLVCSKVFKLYKEKHGNHEAQKGKRNKFFIEKNISLPISDAAYIPASSLKGTIRTALMSEKNKKVFLRLKDIEDKNQKGNTIYKASTAEQKLYSYNNVADDCFKYLKITDLLPQETSLTEVCVAQNYIKQRAKEGKGVYTYVEVIPNNSCFEASLSILPGFVENIQSIATACNNFYGDLFEKEQSFMCEKHNIPAEFFERIRQELKKPNTFLLRIGKYTDAEGKTIDGLRNIYIASQKIFLDHTTSCWFAETDGSKLPFGWCVAEFEEIK